MIIGELLESKGNEVVTIGPEQELKEAIQMLVDRGMGSLVVVKNEQVVGILTERDILRANARWFDTLKGLTVSDVMTTKVVIGLPTDSIDKVMNIMTEQRVRHLPVISSGQLIGILSIGDVVKAKVKKAEVEINHLTDYITGLYPG
jgi:CBS domain-containing protein